MKPEELLQQKIEANKKIAVELHSMEERRSELINEAMKNNGAIEVLRQLSK